MFHTFIMCFSFRMMNAIAHDISFEFSKSLPMRAWGIPLSEAKDAPKMDSGPLIEGIPALGPGEERKIDWGNMEVC